MFSPFGADLARARRQDLLTRAEHARLVRTAHHGRRASTAGRWLTLACVRRRFVRSAGTGRQTADLRVARAVPCQRA